MPPQISGIQFKQMEAFQAVMDRGSTSGAAVLLGLSQSAVSRLLAQFERDVGLCLFKRSKGRLIPTDEAFAILQDAQGLMESVQCLRRHAEQLRIGGFRRELIKVSLPSTLALKLMPAVVDGFVRSHPGTVIELLSQTYLNTERALLSREADIGLIRVPVVLPGLQVVTTLESEAICIMPNRHPLRRLKVVNCADLEDVPLILLGRQGPMRKEIDHLFRQARFAPRVLCEVHAVEVACAFVARGLGLSIVNSLVASHCEDMGFISRPFLPQIPFQMGVATLAQARRRPLEQAFISDLVQALRKPAQHG